MAIIELKETPETPNQEEVGNIVTLRREKARDHPYLNTRTGRMKGSFQCKTCSRHFKDTYNL